MAHALVLTASSAGRMALPGDAGFVLDVDGDAPVTLDVWPYPSVWAPDGVRLYRHDREVAASPSGDDLRWVFTGDDRFGEFVAVAFAAGRAVTSPLLVVQRAGSGVRATSAAAAGVAPSASDARIPQRTANAPADALIDLSASGRPLRPGAPAGLPSSSRAESQPGAGAVAAPGSAAGPTDPPAALGQRSQPTAPRLPAHARPEDLRALAELPAGEYDPRFAAWVGVLFAVLAAGFAGLVISRLLIDVELPAPATPPAADAPISHDGTVAERVGLATSTLLIALGGVLLLAGSALAALEVRARQRRAPATPTTWRTPEAGLRVLPAVLTRLQQIPGVVAVLVVGGITLGLGLIGSLYWPTLF